MTTHADSNFSGRPTPDNLLGTEWIDFRQGGVAVTEKLGELIAAEVLALGYQLTCESQGASPAATASKNALAIQAALSIAEAAGGGVVSLLSGGAYSIDRTLVIGSKTQLLIGAGARLVAVPGGPRGAQTFSAVQNRNFASTMYAVSSIAIAQPYMQDPPAATPPFNMALATVTFTSFNPLAAGWKARQHVHVKGDTNENFNGLWEILSVTSTGLTFLVGQNDAVTAGAGTMMACLADADIRVTGVIDCNFQSGGFTTSGDYNDHGICISHCLRPRMQDAIVYGSRKYQVMMGSVMYPVSDGQGGETGSDGIHIYGPCWSPLVTNFHSDTGDDGVIFQTIDGATFYPYMPPITAGLEDRGGNFYGGGKISFAANRRTRTTSAILYPDGGPTQGYKMFGTYVAEDMSVSAPMLNGGTIGGQARFYVGGGYVTNAGSIEDIVLRNIRGRVTMNNSAAARIVTIGSVTIEGLTNDLTRGDNLTHNYDYVNIGRLTYRGLRLTASSQLFAFGANATISKLSFQDGDFTFGGGGAATSLSVINTTTSAIGEISLERCRTIGAAFMLNDNSTFAAVPLVTAIDCDLSRTIVTSQGQSYNLNLDGVRGTAGQALFNFYGGASAATFNINFTRGSMPTAPSNFLGTVNWNNPDGTVPISLATIARQAGALAKARINTGTGSSADIIANNMCVCDETNTAGSWKQLSAPATRNY